VDSAGVPSRQQKGTTSTWPPSQNFFLPLDHSPTSTSSPLLSLTLLDLSSVLPALYIDRRSFHSRISHTLPSDQSFSERTASDIPYLPVTTSSNPVIGQDVIHHCSPGVEHRLHGIRRCARSHTPGQSSCSVSPLLTVTSH
jgi:hypothetical protein